MYSIWKINVIPWLPSWTESSFNSIFIPVSSRHLRILFVFVILPSGRPVSLSGFWPNPFYFIGCLSGSLPGILRVSRTVTDHLRFPRPPSGPRLVTRVPSGMCTTSAKSVTLRWAPTEPVRFHQLPPGCFRDPPDHSAPLPVPVRDRRGSRGCLRNLLFSLILCLVSARWSDSSLTLPSCGVARTADRRTSGLSSGRSGLAPASRDPRGLSFLFWLGI